MAALHAAWLLVIAAAGLAVVRTRDPTAQVIGVSAYGLAMAVLFALYRAPDVALSQIVVGAVALPLMVLLTLSKIRKNVEERRRAESARRGEEGRR